MLINFGEESGLAGVKRLESPDNLFWLVVKISPPDGAPVLSPVAGRATAYGAARSGQRDFQCPSEQAETAHNGRVSMPSRYRP